MMVSSELASTKVRKNCRERPGATGDDQFTSRRINRRIYHTTHTHTQWEYSGNTENLTKTLQVPKHFFEMIMAFDLQSTLIETNKHIFQNSLVKLFPKAKTTHTIMVSHTIFKAIRISLMMLLPALENSLLSPPRLQEAPSLSNQELRTVLPYKNFYGTVITELFSRPRFTGGIDLTH